MTKFLKKVFVCGVLLSSVSAYCSNAELNMAWGEKLADDYKLTLTESFLVVGDNRTTHANTTIGDLDTGLTLDTKTESDNSITRILQATEFPIANIENQANGTVTLKYLFENGEDKENVVIVGDETAPYHYGTETNANKLYAKGITAGDANYTFITEDSGSTWKNAEDASVEINVMNLLGDENSVYSLDDDTTKLLFTGPVATKAASDSNWKLLNGNNLPRVTLTVSDGYTLTVGDQGSYVEDQDVTTLDGSDVPLGTKLSYHQNNASAFIKFTEFSEVTGKSKIQLLNENPDNVELYNSKKTNISNPTLETKAIIEPGSQFGASGSEVEISDGETDVGGFFEIKDNAVVGNNTDGQQVYASINGKVNIFSKIMPNDATEKSTAIDIFNESDLSGTLSGIKGALTVEVPYVFILNGDNAYKDSNDLGNDLNEGDKFLLNAVSQEKIKGLFASDANIKYTLGNTDYTNKTKDFVTQTIDDIHSIAGSGAKNVYWDVSSVSNMDSEFDSSRYSYNGQAGTQKFNVIPLDGDKYTIPYDNKSATLTSTDTCTEFDLTAKTSLNPNAIQKYLEPNMKDVKIKGSDGVEFANQDNITKTVSTELTGVGDENNMKTLFLDANNNGFNEVNDAGRGPNLTLDNCHLKVKPKDTEVNRNILEVKNGSNIQLRGDMTIYDIRQDSNSTIKIKGGTIKWGSAPAAVPAAQG